MLIRIYQSDKVKDKSVKPRPLEPQPGLGIVIGSIISFQRCSPGLANESVLAQLGLTQRLAREVVPDGNRHEGNALFANVDTVETLEGVQEERDEVGPDNGRLRGVKRERQKAAEYG